MLPASWICFVISFFAATRPVVLAADGRKLAFASYYQNHMVLQQAPERANVWGTGTLGNIVTVTLTGQQVKKVYKTKIIEGFYPDLNTKAGVWKILLDAMPAGGPYTIKVENDNGDVSKIEDVLFGDVWICSGQSNMAYAMYKVMNASDEMGTADYHPQVRMMAVQRVAGSTPRTDLAKISVPWSVSSSALLNGRMTKSQISAVCWMYGRYLNQHLKYPIGLVHSSWGGTPIEKWSSSESLAQCKVPQNKINSEIWNMMVHPFTTMTIKGAIWYQGESNSFSRTSYKYACTFPQMISNWRSKFNQGSGGQTNPRFPFGFVQLSGNKPPPQGSSDKGFPNLRWHQTADYGIVPNPEMSNVFMSVAMDLPDYKSPYGTIHPRHKRDISDRLGLAALGTVYGQNVDYQHSWPNAFIVGAQAITINFDRSRRHLEVRDRNGIEICCSSTNDTFCGEGNSARWVATPILRVNNSSVVINYKRHCKGWVMGVRYAWKVSPCDFKKCALYGAANKLPVPPFIVKERFGLQNQKFQVFHQRQLKQLRLPRN